ncbi:transcription antitermination factor NusB [Caldalkalibacillus salinus]|uniref:transcription antitermination factor NusB n=1 Tax=Caldalkalibacillus salinus TaxID=2803787 RepID=UPI001920F060|nr:transcription antitermination factor NusB [Caldalkalibacillus salinus]
MKRRLARERIIQALYQMDMVKASWQQALSNVLDEEPSDTYLEEVLAGVSEQMDSLDQKITPHLKNWSLERLAITDRAILRLGVYEIFHRDDVPNEVAINEAVELAKSFGTDDSAKFINGLLSNVSSS